ncbi:uncharacterized protein OCT59_003118 [Rhizophagus irregularis]|nr:hypothetical protein OCT59_003118 [Rhizophagus irregularis]
MDHDRNNHVIQLYGSANKYSLWSYVEGALKQIPTDNNYYNSGCMELRFKKDDIIETNQLSNESGALNRKYHDNTAKYKGIVSDGCPNKTTAGTV